MITHYPKDWIGRASAHYMHACEKHPHFADTLLPDNATPFDIRNRLKECRVELANESQQRRVNAMALLDCEVAEACHEIIRNNRQKAIEEIYDAIAVLFRMADLLEKRK